MTTTWGNFRDDLVRTVLKDSAGAEPRWSDAELLGYANLGLDDISVNMAFMRMAALPTATATAVFQLPQDCCRVEYVLWKEEGVTTFLKDTTPLPGYEWGDGMDNGYIVHWPEEDQLTLMQDTHTGVTLQVIYAAYRAHLTGDTSVLPFGTHQWLEEALLYYTGYLAHLREGVGRAALEQWSSKPELLVGNPLNVEAEMWLKAYERVLRNAKPGTNIRMYK
jgi:hypothetical protein